ncbi:MAG TPA: hypothetical protein VFZ66_29195 [Herpetosiphonaceae bacterium]
MIYTLIFGTPVQSSDKQIGRLERIIVDNGIANQVTINPGLLGTERVVPITVLEETSADVIRMNASNDEWKAFAAYQMQQSLSNPVEDTPNLSALTTDQVVAGGITDSSHPTSDTGARRTQRTVGDTSVVLSSRTKIVDDTGATKQRCLKGLVVDTGRPQQLVLDDDSAVPFEAITLLDENQIHIGGAHQAPVLGADQEGITPTLEQPLAERGVNDDQIVSRGE